MQHTYDDFEKMESSAKNRMNQFLGELMSTFVCTDDKSAVVLDAKGFRTSRTLLHKCTDLVRDHIWILNNDPKICSSARRRGFQSIAGISTATLASVGNRGQHVLAYLDYCGTPRGSCAIGWDPLADIRTVATELLVDGGYLAMTFCKRGCKDAEDYVWTMLRQVSSDVGIVPCFVYRYCETQAMFVVVVQIRQGHTGILEPNRIVERAFAHCPEQTYEIHGICGSRRVRGKTQYRVTWSDMSETWEPAALLMEDGLNDEICHFERRKKRKRIR